MFFINNGLFVRVFYFAKNSFNNFREFVKRNVTVPVNISTVKSNLLHENNTLLKK